jgi:hypothetical protein
VRVVHGDKELVEKLGRRDLCPVRIRSPLSSGAVCNPAGMTASTATTIFRE